MANGNLYTTQEAVNVLTTLGVNAGAVSLFTIAYDYIKATYPNVTTEVYTTRIGGAAGSIQQTVTLVYTDSTKSNLDSVTRA